METAEKLSKAYDALQELNIISTRGNMEKLMFALMAIKEAYDKLKVIEEQKQAGDGNGADRNVD